MREGSGSPAESEFEHKGKKVSVYAIHIENAPGKFTFQVVIDGRPVAAEKKGRGISHSEAVRAGQNYARQVIDGGEVE